jgi:hypothetical protein
MRALHRSRSSADSDEAGHPFRREGGHHSDVKAAGSGSERCPRGGEVLREVPPTCTAPVTQGSPGPLGRFC